MIACQCPGLQRCGCTMFVSAMRPCIHNAVFFHLLANAHIKSQMRCQSLFSEVSVCW